jgi:hypothetical protein
MTGHPVPTQQNHTPSQRSVADSFSAICHFPRRPGGGTCPDLANGDHRTGACGRHRESAQSGRPPCEIDAGRRRIGLPDGLRDHRRRSAVRGERDITSGMADHTRLTSISKPCMSNPDPWDQRPGPVEVSTAGPQTAAIPVMTRRYSSGLLTLAAHSLEDSRRDRKCRSARLQRTVPKGLFQYRTADLSRRS